MRIVRLGRVFEPKLHLTLGNPHISKPPAHVIFWLILTKAGK